MYLSLYKTTNLLKNKIKQFKSAEYQSYLNNLSSQNGSLWRATKNITKTKKNISPIDGTYSITDKQKFYTLAHQFSNPTKILSTLLLTSILYIVF